MEKAAFFGLLRLSVKDPQGTAVIGQIQRTKEIRDRWLLELVTQCTAVDWQELLLYQFRKSLDHFQLLAANDIRAAGVLARRLGWLALHSTTLPAVQENRKQAGESRWRALVRQAQLKMIIVGCVLWREAKSRCHCDDRLEVMFASALSVAGFEPTAETPLLRSVIRSREALASLTLSSLQYDVSRML